MKINCDYFKDRREAREATIRSQLEEWHDWYAWFPVRISHNDCRWLETIKRRGNFSYRHFDGWDYMPVKSTLERAGK